MFQPMSLTQKARLKLGVIIQSLDILLSIIKTATPYQNLGRQNKMMDKTERLIQVPQAQCCAGNSGVSGIQTVVIQEGTQTQWKGAQSADSQSQISNAGAWRKEFSSPGLRVVLRAGWEEGRVSCALKRNVVTAEQRKYREYNPVENPHAYYSGQRVKSCNLRKFPHSQMGIWYFQLILEGTQVLYIEIRENSMQKKYTWCQTYK